MNMPHVPFEECGMRRFSALSKHCHIESLKFDFVLTWGKSLNDTSSNKHVLTISWFLVFFSNK